MTYLTPIEFDGVATLTPEKLAVIKNWYLFSQRYANAALADTALDNSEKQIYLTMANTVEDLLALLYKAQEKVVEEVVKSSSKSSGRGRKKLILVVGVVGVVYLVDRKLKKDAEAKAAANKLKTNYFEPPAGQNKRAND
jgi:hypothetical protein